MSDELRTPPDYDFPVEDPDAKELAAQLRPGNLVLNLKAVPEPLIEIFRDQLVPLQKEPNPYLVLFIQRGDAYRYYSIPFSVIAPLLQWVRLSAEKRPRWHLNLVPRRNLLVARNGARVENIDLARYLNRRPVKTA